MNAKIEKRNIKKKKTKGDLILHLPSRGEKLI